MKLSVASWSFPYCTHEETVGIVKALGIGAVDVGFFYRAALDKNALLADPEGTAERLKTHDIELSNLYYLFGSSPEERNLARPADLEANVTDFKKVLAFCKAAEVPSVMLLPGVLNKGQGRNDALVQTAKALEQLLPLAKGAGVVLAIEPHVHSYLENPSLVLNLVERVPGLKLVLDYAHFVCLGYRQEEIDILAPYAAHVHLRQARAGVLQDQTGRRHPQLSRPASHLARNRLQRLLSARVRPSALHEHALRRCTDRNRTSSRFGEEFFMKFSGQVAVVTGGATGIGKAIATRLHREGAQVVIADLDAERASATASELSGLGVSADVTSSASVDALVDTVRQHYGRLDVLVNNAGIHIQKLAVDLGDEEWDAILSTNARGCFFTCRAAAKLMMRQESGRIINIITRLGGNPFSSAYIASKSAVWGFTQCLALELAPYHITVNAVAPGHIGLGTGMEKWFRAKAELLEQDWETFEGNVLKSIPLGRWCTPEDVARAVAFLASDEAGFITGEQVNVTGGWTGYGATPPKIPQEKEVDL